MKIELPKPKHPTGYTEAEVRKILGDNDDRFKLFCEYMRGATCGLSDKNEILYYKLDVSRFLDGLPPFD